MLRKINFVGALFLLLAALKPPASLLDAALARFSEGGLRLAEARGSLWRGEALLASQQQHGLQTWTRLAWQLDLRDLSAGELGWQLFEAGQPLAQLRLSAQGWRIEQLELDIAPRILLDPLPNAIARAGWQGHLHASSPGLRCNWQQQCNGNLQLLWRNAGLDLVPQQRFGDYRLSLQAEGRSATLELITLRGAIQADAQGRWDGRRLQLDGELAGPPDVVGRLPNIARPIAEPTGDPRRVRIKIR